MSKNLFAYDFANKVITGTKTALRIAGRDITSLEYKELEKMMMTQPTFKVAVRETKSTKNKRTYKNLTMATMEEYITTQPDSEKQLAKFEAVKRVAKLKNGYYPITKQWFLKAYPNYKTNEKLETEIAELTAESSKTVEFPKAVNE